MNKSNLKFSEYYISENPPEDTHRYWRGIIVSVNNIPIFDIDYKEKKNKFILDSHFFIRSKLLPETIIDEKMNFIFLQGIFDENGARIIYYDKEEAKKGAIKAYNHLLNLLS